MLLAVLILQSGRNHASAALSVSYYDGLIVFHFADDYPTGRFANGDFWVHNHGSPVVITGMAPASRVDGSGRTINGAMRNPGNSTVQGYDSKPRDMGYDPSLNVDPGHTGADLVAAPGTSVVKAISTESDAGRPIISDAAVLTVLSGPPPAGSFRPPYSGLDKTIPATTADLDLSQLGRFPRLGGEPDIGAVADSFARVWLEHCTEWVQRDIHPVNHMPAYGRDIAGASGRGLLLLQLDYTDQEKRDLLIRLVQYGLDLYGVARSGGIWYNNGGHNLGRKLPLLLAAKVLHHGDMLAWADKEQHFIFQDDQQHFFVSQREVDITHSSAWAPDDRAETLPYLAEDIGMAEWGIRHADRPTADNRSWGALYRHVNGPAQTTHIFAAQLMGVKMDWNWPPVFAYADRYFAQEKDNGRFPGYFVALWTAYRDVVDKDQDPQVSPGNPGTASGSNPGILLLLQ